MQSAAVIGAGPAGLTAALEFSKLGVRVDVFEKYTRVGGIARTEQHKGYSFDMGGHRFYSKSSIVTDLWQELMGQDFLLRPRLSRIYYQRKYFSYPPQIFNALYGLGVIESIRVMWSYVWCHVRPYNPVVSFEHWVTNAFGKRLFEIFFKSYTEKVWGIPCSELSSEWAAQRIRGMSIKKVLLNLIDSRRTPTSLIEEFHYPRRGPGMMWEKVAELIEGAQGSVQMQQDVIAIRRDGFEVKGILMEDADGNQTEHNSSYYVSSMPLPELIRKFDPPAPEPVLEAAKALTHRAFLTVCLVVDHPDLFDDNWIYVHEPGVKVGRIQNYKNWSEDMVPDSTRSSLGLEYFCDEGDELWSMSDADLVALAEAELRQIKLIPEVPILEGYVHRVADAYPVYSNAYRNELDILREFCDQFTNLCTVGRNGLHRYNNQDHSMLTGLFAARMLHLGEHHDLWSINAEQEYLEEKS